jgi:AcrR family transcriptional regulator
MKEARAYESPLRAEQMEETRRRILRAVTEALADPTTAEVTIPLVARRARVSLRTVYRHFRTREALFDAWAARVVRKRTRRRRQRQFERAMSELTDELEPKERLRAIAVLYLLVSAPAWQAMREQWGLDGVEAGKAAAWAVRVLVDELNRNPDSIRDVTKEEKI